MCKKTKVEDKNHLFVNCSFNSKIWYVVLAWLGVSVVLPNDAKSLFIWMGGFVRVRRVKRLIFIFWHVTVWCLWNLRNQIIFKSDSIEFLACMAHIKIISWQWLFSKNGVKTSLFFSSWCCCPLDYILE